ncbi:MAG: thioredoxin [Thaumarchaeota archaeon]|nr:thioredoxin [Nitrososphaerota archaeon]
MSDPELERILEEKARRLVSPKPVESVRHGEILELTEANFDKHINGGKPAFVDFWAVWCGPCRTMEPIVERLASKLGDSVTFGKVNVDEHPTVATRYQVQSIPTFMIFNHGAPVDAIIGTMSESALEQRVRRVSGS